MRWTVHGRRELYTSQWMTLSLVDVEVPGGHRYEHHAVGGPDAAGTLVSVPDRGVLMIWRHRVLADAWGWEIPAGLVDPGESPRDAARRECIEESGWEPHGLTPLRHFLPIAGQATQTFHIFTADDATEVGDPEPGETERVGWLDDEALRAALDRDEVLDAMSVIAVLAHLAGIGQG